MGQIRFRQGTRLMRLIAAIVFVALLALDRPSNAQNPEKNRSGGLGVATAATRWQAEPNIDRLTGKTQLLFRNRAIHPFAQLGHSVQADLYLACRYGGLVAMIIFSERIGFSEVMVRARFDDGPVYEEFVHFSNDYGRTIPFEILSREDGAGSFEPIVPTLLAASRVRVELGNLPWATNPLLEFDTRQASVAVSKLPCSP